MNAKEWIKNNWPFLVGGVTLPVIVGIVVWMILKLARAPPSGGCPTNRAEVCKGECYAPCPGVHKRNMNTCECSDCADDAHKCDTEKVCQVSRDACISDDQCRKASGNQSDACVPNPFSGACVYDCGRNAVELGDCSCECKPGTVSVGGVCQEKAQCENSENPVNPTTGIITGQIYDPVTNSCSSDCGTTQNCIALCKRSKCETDVCKQEGKTTWDSYDPATKRCAMFLDCKKEFVTEDNCPKFERFFPACNPTNYALMNSSRDPLRVPFVQDGNFRCDFPTNLSEGGQWQRACESVGSRCWDATMAMCMSNNTQLGLEMRLGGTYDGGTYQVMENAVFKATVAYQKPSWDSDDGIDAKNIVWTYTFTVTQARGSRAVQTKYVYAPVVKVATDPFDASRDFPAGARVKEVEHTIYLMSLQTDGSPGMFSPGQDGADAIVSVELTASWRAAAKSKCETTWSPAQGARTLQIKGPQGQFNIWIWDKKRAGEIASNIGDINSSTKNIQLKRNTCGSGNMCTIGGGQCKADSGCPQPTLEILKTDAKSGALVCPLFRPLLASDTAGNRMAVILAWAKSSDAPSSPPPKCSSVPASATLHTALFRLDPLNGIFITLFNLPNSAPAPTAWIDTAPANSRVTYTLISYWSKAALVDPLYEAKCRSTALTVTLVIPRYTTSLCAAMDISIVAGNSSTIIPPFAWATADGACTWSPGNSGLNNATQVADLACLFDITKEQAKTGIGSRSFSDDDAKSAQLSNLDVLAPQCAQIGVTPGGFDMFARTGGFVKPHCESVMPSGCLQPGFEDAPRSFSCANQYRVGDVSVFPCNTAKQFTRSITSVSDDKKTLTLAQGSTTSQTIVEGQPIIGEDNQRATVKKVETSGSSTTITLSKPVGSPLSVAFLESVGCPALENRIQSAVAWGLNDGIISQKNLGILAGSNESGGGVDKDAVTNKLYRPRLLEACPPLRGAAGQTPLDLQNAWFDSEYGVPGKGRSDPCATDNPESTEDQEICRQWNQSAGSYVSSSGSRDQPGPNSILRDWECTLNPASGTKISAWQCTQDRLCFSPYVGEGAGGAQADGKPYADATNSPCCEQQGTWTPPQVENNAIQVAGSCACAKDKDGNVTHEGKSCQIQRQLNYCVYKDPQNAYGDEECVVEYGNKDSQINPPQGSRATCARTLAACKKLVRCGKSSSDGTARTNIYDAPWNVGDTTGDMSLPACRDPAVWETSCNMETQDVTSGEANNDGAIPNYGSSVKVVEGSGEYHVLKSYLSQADADTQAESFCNRKGCTVQKSPPDNLSKCLNVDPLSECCWYISAIGGNCSTVGNVNLNKKKNDLTFTGQWRTGAPEPYGICISSPYPEQFCMPITDMSNDPACKGIR